MLHLEVIVLGEGDRSIKGSGMIWRQQWQTRHQLETALFQYINGFYNPRRRHSTLGGTSPIIFEQKTA